MDLLCWKHLVFVILKSGEKIKVAAIVWLKNMLNICYRSWNFRSMQSKRNSSYKSYLRDFSDLIVDFKFFHTYFKAFFSATRWMFCSPIAFSREWNAACLGWGFHGEICIGEDYTWCFHSCCCVLSPPRLSIILCITVFSAFNLNLQVKFKTS